MNTRFTKKYFGLLLTGGSLITTLGVFGMFPQSAWAINRVSDQQCRDRTDFFKLWNNTTIANGVCFANPGTASVRIYNVYRITNGNNYGSILYTVGSKRHTLSFCRKFLRVNFTSTVDVVTSVTLTANPPSQCYRTTGTKDYQIETNTEPESSQVDELPVITEPDVTTESKGINEESVLVNPTQLTEP
ncbi:MAG: hypothetical protein KME30_30330 [Iphinoe sp. HA4291-MV1]|jgi:hypothetical protein|nr:hypothetical protein [Iphinoe sp. HA4291-MV1]